MADFFSSRVTDCKYVELPNLNTSYGHIATIRGRDDIPFAIKRIYYTYDIPDAETRGSHAHLELHQLMVAISGSFSIDINDGKNIKTFHLNRPDYGLLIVPGIWRELYNFSSGAVCFVLASEHYSELDYIRNYEIFKAKKHGK